MAVIGQTMAVIGPTMAVIGPTMAVIDPTMAVIGPTMAVIGSTDIGLPVNKSDNYMNSYNCLLIFIVVVTDLVFQALNKFVKFSLLPKWSIYNDVVNKEAF